MVFISEQKETLRDLFSPILKTLLAILSYVVMYLRLQWRKVENSLEVYQTKYTAEVFKTILLMLFMYITITTLDHDPTRWTPWGLHYLRQSRFRFSYRFCVHKKESPHSFFPDLSNSGCMYINFTEFSYENNTNYATALMNEHIKQNTHAVRNQSKTFWFRSVSSCHIFFY